MHNRALATLFFTIFLDMVGVGILIPVVPVILADPTSPHYLLPIGTSPRVGYILLGFMFALYSFGQFIASPIIGQFSDKFGRKKMLLFSVLGTAIGHALFALAVTWKFIPLLLLTRLFTGIMTGNIVVAQASIADITPPEHRAANFGLIGAAFGLGFVIGPFLGGRLADGTLVSWFTAATPFWFAALLSVLNFFFIITMLKETNMHRRSELWIDWGRSVKNIFHAFSLKTLRPLFITGFLFNTGFTFYMTFFSVFLFFRFGFTEASIGNYFAYTGLWIIFTQSVVTRALSKKWSERQILKRSLIVAGLGLLAILLCPESSWLYFAVPFFSVSVGLTGANLTALISRSAGASVQGEILGINGSVNALAMIFPPLLAGTIAAKFDPQAPLLIATIFIIMSGIYFIGHTRRSRA
ncbi:MAG: MFS transporter [bacterium]|nr:MFS transporter [bacterium]